MTLALPHYHRPRTLAEALALRGDHPDRTILAGGTDLMVNAHERSPPTGIIDLFGLADLGLIKERDGVLRLGSATTYSRILGSPVVQARAPLLVACAREIGALQIQERGTLGGNIATASPVGDTLPVLLAYDAEIEVASRRGIRRIPYADFITGYRRTALAADELITAVQFPAGALTRRWFWRKVGTRRAQSISKVMVAGSARRDPDGILHDVRWALGAVADRPLRAQAVERLLAGKKATVELADAAAAAVAQAISPIDDIRSTASYRARVAANLTRRFVQELMVG